MGVLKNLLVLPSFEVGFGVGCLDRLEAGPVSGHYEVVLVGGAR